MAERSLVPVRIVLADRGAFHEMVLQVPADVLARYARLIDALREDPEVTASAYIDFRRLVAARLADE